MGQLESTRALSVENNDGEIEDISKKVTDSSEDVNDLTYQITITCRGDYRLHKDQKKDPKVTSTLSSEPNEPPPNEHWLMVVANNRMYYNSCLPHAASNCVHKIKRKKEADLLVLTITKSEAGSWTASTGKL